MGCVSPAEALPASGSARERPDFACDGVRTHDQGRLYK
jgi:hypothetical protein